MNKGADIRSGLFYVVGSDKGIIYVIEKFCEQDPSMPISALLLFG